MKSTIHELLSWAEPRLSNKNVLPEEARDLLAWTLNKSASFLVGHSSDSISLQKEKNFKDLIRKRIRGIPFSYLVGSKGFYGLDFFVNENVLIPRPETEELVDMVLRQYDKNFSGLFADVGTGSGAIGVTLSKFLPHGRCIAIDTSFKALQVAKTNARKHKVARRITFRNGSLLGPLRAHERIVFVVANLPYLEKHELVQVPFEPVEALYGGNHGLEHIDALINQIINRDISHAILEIAPRQEGWLETKMAEQDVYAYKFLKDSTGRIRFIELKKK